MLEDKEIMLIQNEDGTFSEYDDSNDITISCENEKTMRGSGGTTEKTAQTSKTDYLRCIKWRH